MAGADCARPWRIGSADAVLRQDSRRSCRAAQSMAGAGARRQTLVAHASPLTRGARLQSRYSSRPALRAPTNSPAYDILTSVADNRQRSLALLSALVAISTLAPAA